jgi:hypothetical protein
MSVIGDRLRERAGAEKRSDDRPHPGVPDQIDSELESLSNCKLLSLLNDGVQPPYQIRDLASSTGVNCRCSGFLSTGDLQ